MNRRAFIKRNGIWLTGALAFPAIVRAQVMPSARHIAAPKPNASTPFPLTISGLKLWYKADAGAYSDTGTTLCTDGTTVRQWNDQSGNSVNASQSNSGKRPTWYSTTHSQNGLPVVNFVGASSNTMGLSPSVTSGNKTFFFVINPVTISAQVDIFDSQTGRLVFFWNNTLQVAWNDSGGERDFSYGVTFVNTWVSLIFQLNSTGTAGYVYRDGSKSSAKLYTATALGGTTTLGSAYNGLGAFLDGYLGEMGVYDSDIGSTNITALQSYLKTKWGTP